MYDSESEIKEKRKKLLLIIGVSLFLFILLIVIIVSVSNRKPKPVELSCVLVANKEPVNNKYNEPITVSIEVTGGNSIVSKNVGINENARRNKETYTISNNGTTTLVGYVEDSNGKTTTCSGTFELELSLPTCELKVTEGKIGLNDWYVSDVVVSFDNMNSNIEGVDIVSYSITKSLKDPETDREFSRVNENNDSLNISDNGNFELIGRVEDEYGNTGECKLDVSIDKEKPTCELYIISKETNSDGTNKVPVVVGIKESNDEVSDIYEKGVGIEKNYKGENYLIDTYGNNIIYGYVKDNAGNENTCELEVVTIKEEVKETEKPQENENNTEKETDKKYDLLSDVVKIGDMVNYDAGLWNVPNRSLPSKKCEGASCFGGVNTDSKNKTVSICTNNNDVTKSGWVVLSNSNGVVELVHAGVPECFFFNRNNYDLLTSRTNVYVNTIYATSARLLSYSDYQKNGGKEEYKKIFGINSRYFLGDLKSKGVLYYIKESGEIGYGSLWTYGYRPVVTLKSKVYTSGINSNGSYNITIYSNEEEANINKINSDILVSIRTFFEK